MSTISLPDEGLLAYKHRPNPIQTQPLALALLLVAFGTVYIAQAVRGRQALLFLLGCATGVILFHAAFGFTSSWRIFIADRRGEGLRAQMLMLAVASVLFVPALASESILGQAVRGNISPLGLAVIAGAFVFGAGMQLGGG